MQGSLLDLGDDVGLAPLSGHVTRTELAHGAWIDHRPSWITASDTVLEHLLHEVTWVAERRRMFVRTSSSNDGTAQLRVLAPAH